MLITEILFKDRSIRLCDSASKPDENTFTVVIGRNGSGKSSLLQKICLMHIAVTLDRNDMFNGIHDIFDYYELEFSSPIDETGSISYTIGNTLQTIKISQPKFLPQDIDLSSVPEKHRAAFVEDLRNRYIGNRQSIFELFENGLATDVIKIIPQIIAVSSSPFDKFPSLDEHRLRHSSRNLRSSYYYRGARTRDRSSKSYIRSKFDQLGTSFINFFLRAKTRKKEISPLFKYLGLNRKFTIHLTFPHHFRLDDLVGEKARDPSDAIRSVRFFKGKGNDEEIPGDEKQRIVEIAKSIKEGMYGKGKTESFYRRDEVFSFTFDIDDESDLPKYLVEFSELAEYDLVDLANIEFTKNKDNSKFLLTEASSGELCILFNLLSIAGVISDNSVVLIDEPELSLHPEWQKDFIPLLREVFVSYKGCHFVVATHSPHMVSSLPRTNAYVVNLEENPALPISGAKVGAKSADYQLASTFKFPGHQNEYLITQLVEVLTLLSEGNNLGDELRSRIGKLLEFDSLVPEEDPVRKLLSTLRKAVDVLSK